MDAAHRECKAPTSSLSLRFNHYDGSLKIVNAYISHARNYKVYQRLFSGTSELYESLPLSRSAPICLKTKDVTYMAWKRGSVKLYHCTNQVLMDVVIVGCIRALASPAPLGRS